MMLALALAAAAAARAEPATIGHALMALDGTRQASYRDAMAQEAWLFDAGVQPAQAVLAGRTGAWAGRSWWPARTVTSCDGGLALSTGTFQNAGAPPRHFVTVWERQTDRQWRWVFDGPIAESASDRAPTVTLAACGRVVPVQPDPSWEASGESGDGTLRWRVFRDGDVDRHRLVAEYLTKSGWQTFEDATVG